MSCATSLSTGQVYGVARVAREWEMARSSFYHQRQLAVPFFRVLQRRGPKTAWTDAALTEKIREVLAASPFYGEGHRKVWARLRHAGVRTSKARVLRLMREAQLLAPSRTVPRVENPHTGTIIPERPNEVWASDHTATVTVENGQVTVFVAVDHCTTECVGLHAARRATRFEALEPIRQAVRDYCGGFRADAAAGIRLRHDHGSQYMSDDFQAEIAFLGMESSPAFVRQPEGNGCVERFIRTLKEQLLWVRTFQTVEELGQALAEFRERYNRRWIVERLGYLTPQQARQQLLAQGVAA
jgi:transposase InsO family protein